MSVTVSPKYQVVIPVEVRREMGIKPGQKLDMLVIDGQISLVPVTPARALRGFAKGITTTFEREGDRI